MSEHEQKDGLYLEDPLERLRTVFREYWQFIVHNQLEKAEAFWEKEISIELNKFYEMFPEVPLESVQAILFEEKRMLQDQKALVDAISHKLSVEVLPQQFKRLSAQIQQPVSSFSDQKKSKRTESKSTAKASGGASKNNRGKSSTGFDLTAMIDTMLDEEKSK